MLDSPASAISISIVVPVRNESENVDELLGELETALSDESAVEYIFVDDGSTDGTWATLTAARATCPRLRALRHRKSCGQSCALLTAARHARGSLLVTLDGDGQNDPADIPALLSAYRDAARSGKTLGLVAGQRRRREDNLVRRIGSRVANAANRKLLRHEARDTGCGLKLLPREVFLRLPYFDHLHRFLPALIRREGLETVYLEVSHRPRLKGQSKYGTLDRLWVGIIDLFGVRWLQSRRLLPETSEECDVMLTDQKKAEL